MPVFLSLYGSPADHLLPLARLLDEVGFDGLWLGEHLVAPAAYESLSEYRRHEVVVPLDIELSDPWVSAGAVLAATTHLTVGTGVTVPPLRHPLLTARAAITTSQLFPGRLLLGVGAGWLREEFEAFGQDHATRGDRLDEGLEIIKGAAAGGLVAYSGRYYAFAPVQVTRSAVSLTVVASGLSGRALARCARVTDGWYNPGTVSLDECCRIRDRLAELRQAAGRADDPFTCHIRMMGPVTAALVEDYRAAGFTHLSVAWQSAWDGYHAPFAVKEAGLRRIAEELGLRPGVDHP